MSFRFDGFEGNFDDNMTVVKHGDRLAEPKRGSLRRRAAKTLILVGLLLLGVNLIGLLHFKTVEDNDPNLLDDHPRTVTEQEFWAQAERRDQESVEAYARRLTRLISDRMLLISPAYTRPTFFENWLLWLYSAYLGRYEWIDTRRAVRLGGGYCSQHAIVLNNILREQGIDSRILSLQGHVANEVLIDGKWRVFDPDYNVVFEDSLHELVDDPRKVYLAYREAGRPEDEAQHWKDVFASQEDNWHFRTAMRYSPRRYVIETASLYTIWIVPAAALVLGFFLIAIRR